MLLENLPYPQDHRVRPEAIALTSEGYRVSIICPTSPGQSSRETVDGVHVYRYAAPTPANSFLGYLWEYGYSMLATFALSLLIFWREGFDVIHAHNPPDTFVFIACFYKLFGKRFIFDHHDLSPEMYCARFSGGGNLLVHRVLLFLEKFTCRIADHVIATNESYKKIEMERDGVAESRITVVRNGPDLNRLQPVSPASARRLKRKFVIGYAGVMGFQDGVDYLLRSLDHLIHDFGRTDFLCIILGNGDAFDSLRELTERLNLSRYVSFTGMVTHEEVGRHLSAADICVAPEPSSFYIERSTAIKIMEYMSLAKPVVAFDLIEHRFTAQGAAAYARPNDERDFARTMAELMDDPARREAMGRIGRRRIETELAWQFSCPLLLQAYRQVFLSPADIRSKSLQKATGGIQVQARVTAPGQSARCESGDATEMRL